MDYNREEKKLLEALQKARDLFVSTAVLDTVAEAYTAHFDDLANMVKLVALGRENTPAPEPDVIHPAFDNEGFDLKGEG